ncbi:HRDC domain-containing protein [Clostridium saccharobutylicum]|uniref:Ribonuclease D n=1 Tax=Clostridium saccharobutylicum TaxID=169679 RepID=A0A1S8NDS6_CLOSA|nr:NERD domain-containing protein [Clostridium saccharobutylicum]OOM14532.1 ribonuclease D [Clostridium saccharobutylicum]
MGFISKLFNIESSQFKTITKPKAIKEFSTENDNLKILDELLSKLKNDEKKDRVSKEIKAMKRGLQGEKTVDFELKNCISPFIYLHDIRIEYDGLTAQIDYLVITKKYICVIEAKQLLGDVNINSDGEFIRVYKNRNGYENKEGMPSPIEQNKKHINLVKRIINEIFGCNSIPVKSLVIMANPKAIIRKKYASQEIQDQIIRSEKLGNYIENLDKELKKAVFKEETAFKIANYLKEKHIPIKIDYEAKFGISEQDFHEESSFAAKEINEEDESYSNDINVNGELEIINKLKKFRTETAKKEKIRPFMIFKNEQIDELIKAKPKTKEQLLAVRGFGEIKAQKYGEEILNIFN